ncbi:MAG: sporulation transcription factor Spo0A, partial [Clostridia bacterium]
SVVLDCDGESAYKLLPTIAVDVVICEIIMPSVDGFCLLEEYGKKTKFIIATELKSELFVLRAMDLGASYYMVKPIDYNILYKRIEQAISSSVSKSVFAPLPTKFSPQKSLDEKLSNIFMTVGIPAHIKGFQFLREGIKLVVSNPPIIGSITKSLYPTIAQKFDTTPSKVERAIRHAIEVAWNRGKIENINSVFGIKIYTSNDKPTNGEFIALLADKMLLDTSC